MFVSKSREIVSFFCRRSQNNIQAITISNLAAIGKHVHVIFLISGAQYIYTIHHPDFDITHYLCSYIVLFFDTQHFSITQHKTK